MVILEIKSIKKVNPKEWKFDLFKDLKPGQYVYTGFGGDHNGFPEYGSVVLSSKVVSGELDGISELIFISDGPMQVKLLNYKKQFFGGFEIEVHFESLFQNGLKNMAKRYIHQGIKVVGLTADEKESLLSSVITQKDFLDFMSSYIIPKRKESIIDFAKLGFTCTPSDNAEETVSHFMGSPKHPESEILDKNNKPLFHLATINLEDVSSLETILKASNKLSFYLRIEDTENGWPEEKSDFKVFNYNKYNLLSSTNDFEKAQNIEFKAFLDLPGYNHSLLHINNFSSEEINNYVAVRTVYLLLLFGDGMNMETNKLFGYPDSVQNCVAYEAERIFNKREYGDEIFKDASEWCLLLQVSPYATKFDFFEEFGDGTIYYMIRKEDLKNGNFGNCQIVVQNT